MTTALTATPEAGSLFVFELDGDTLTAAELDQYRADMDELVAENAWLRLAENTAFTAEEGGHGNPFVYRLQYCA